MKAAVHLHEAARDREPEPIMPTRRRLLVLALIVLLENRLASSGTMPGPVSEMEIATPPSRGLDPHGDAARVR